MGLWSKTEASYKNVVVRLLGQLRTDGEMPYAWIADSTRWMRKPDTFSSAEAALRRTAQTYRRALWATQPDYVEVWLEKEALAGVLVEVTDEWDVPLMVTRGYPSLSFLHSAAETITDATNSGHEPVILYVGDHDPSGLDIERNVWERLQDLTGCRIQVSRLAVTPGQIVAYDLPTRPTKATDSRARTWAGGGSVEVDAIDPDQLRHLLRDAIEQHVDQPALSLLRTIEAEERTLLHRLLTREFPP